MPEVAAGVDDASGPSRTALMVAAYRGRASARENAVCHDPWAAELAGEEGRGYAEQYDRNFPHMELWMAVRTAFIDACVRRYVGPKLRAGIDQVVILGAGLDTRAARMGLGGVTWYEVDSPASSRLKRERVASIPGYPVEAAAFVTCDFRHDDFLDRLVCAGFCVERPAFFIWEGVSYYLPEEAVRGTLARIGQGTHPYSMVVFDYVSRRFVDGATTSRQAKASVEMVASLGEPFVWGTNDCLPLLYASGFRWVRTTRWDEACLAFTGTYDRAREFRFQSLALASARPPDLP